MPDEPVEPPFPITTITPPPPTADQPVAEAPPPTPSPGDQTTLKEPVFKKYLPFIIGFGVVLLLFLLVSKVILPRFQKPKTAAVVSLTYWGLWEPENLMTQIIDDYRKDHSNVTIQYVRQSPKDYRERLQSSLAKGEGPDIFRWHNTWLPMLKNDLTPVPDSIYSANDFDATFFPITKKDVYISGSYYGIPLEFDALALYVNEDIFKQNPDIKVPTTWDNLRQTAFKLTIRDARGQVTRGGVAMGTTNNVDHFSDILGLMILQNGGDPGQPDEKTVIPALKFYTLFSKQDRSWSDALPNSTLAFATGKVAMMLAPSWRAIEVAQQSPQLDFKLYPVPQLPGTNVNWASYWIEGVAKKSTQQSAAWEFLKYLSSPEVITKMYQLAGQTRLFGEPYPRQEMVTQLQADPFTGAIMTQALSARSWPLAARTFDNGLNDRLIKYYQDAVNSFLNDQEEKQTLEALTSGVSQVLSQYGLAAPQ